MREGAKAMVAVMTSLAATPQTRKLGGHVLSGNGRPYLTLTPRRRSASTISSRDPPAKAERAPIPIDPLRSHNLSLLTFQESLESKVNCLRQLLLWYEL